MKIAKVLQQNRSKGGKNIQDIYIRFYTKPNPIKTRVRNMFIYKKPQNKDQTLHNKNINYEIDRHISDLKRDQRLGTLDIEDYNKPTEDVRQWAEKWLESKDCLSVSKASYKIALNLFDEYFGKGRTFVDVKHEHAMKFKNWLKKDCVSRYGSPYSVNSLNTYLNRMKVIFEQAIKQGIQTYKRRNPFSDGLYFKAKKVMGEYISSEEYNLLDYKKCLAPELAKAFMFSILTGLRTGDLKNILWKEIVKDENGWFAYFRMSKGSALIRVSFPEKCMDLIGERGIDNERVFKYSQSNQETTYFNMWLSQSLPKKRIGQTNEGLTFHSARNSFVTNLLIKGVPPIRVQKYVGHKDLKTTLSYYRGGSEMQEIDIQMYMDDIDAKRSVLKAKDLIS